MEFDAFERVAAMFLRDAQKNNNENQTAKKDK